VKVVGVFGAFFVRRSLDEYRTRFDESASCRCRSIPVYLYQAILTEEEVTCPTHKFVEQIATAECPSKALSSLLVG
jgi:hypothetical protein